MNRNRSFFWGLILTTLSVMISVGHTYAQTKSESDLAFHVAQKDKCKKERQSDLIIEHLRGRVKTTRTEDYSYRPGKDGKVAANLRNTTLCSYDTSGNMLSKKISSPGSMLVYKRTFDTNGYILTASEEYSSSLFHDTSSISYCYNSRGILTKETNYWLESGRRHSGSFKNFDAAGRCLSEIRGSHRQHFKYDIYGNCILLVDSDTNNFDKDLVISTTYYSYDRSCRLIQSRKVDAIPCTKSYKYDDKDSVIEIKEEYPLAGEVTMIRYKYDEQGNETEKECASARVAP